MSLFAELKRRNVVRMAIAYAAVSWLLIEVSDTVLPRLGLPDWTVTFVIALLMLGFPLALFFSWTHEITPDGIRKEQQPGGDKSSSLRAGLARLTASIAPPTRLPPGPPGPRRRLRIASAHIRSVDGLHVPNAQ